MPLLKSKISHNEAPNVYLQFIVFEGMGHERTQPCNCQSELVTFKPFLTDGLSFRSNLDCFHRTLHCLTITKPMRTGAFCLLHSKCCFFLIWNPQQSVATPALIYTYIQIVTLYFLRTQQRAVLLSFNFASHIAHQKTPQFVALSKSIVISQQIKLIAN